jgi:hypothetical protein
LGVIQSALFQQLNSAREVIFHVLAVLSTDQDRKFVMYGRATRHNLVRKGVRLLSALAAWNSSVSGFSRKKYQGRRISG